MDVRERRYALDGWIDVLACRVTQVSGPDAFGRFMIVPYVVV